MRTARINFTVWPPVRPPWLLCMPIPRVLSVWTFSSTWCIDVSRYVFFPFPVFLFFLLFPLFRPFFASCRYGYPLSLLIEYVREHFRQGSKERTRKKSPPRFPLNIPSSRACSLNKIFINICYIRNHRIIIFHRRWFPKLDSNEWQFTYYLMF